jgi:hypothetical protein
MCTEVSTGDRVTARKQPRNQMGAKKAGAAGFDRVAPAAVIAGQCVTRTRYPVLRLIAVPDFPICVVARMEPSELQANQFACRGICGSQHLNSVSVKPKQLGRLERSTPRKRFAKLSLDCEILALFDRMKSEYDLHRLTPKSSFVAVEPLEDPAVKIGKA